MISLLLFLLNIRAFTLSFIYLFILFFPFYSKLQVYKKKLFFQIKFTDFAFLTKINLFPPIFNGIDTFGGEQLDSGLEPFFFL